MRLFRVLFTFDDNINQMLNQIETQIEYITVLTTIIYSFFVEIISFQIIQNNSNIYVRCFGLFL